MYAYQKKYRDYRDLPVLNETDGKLDEEETEDEELFWQCLSFDTSLIWPVCSLSFSTDFFSQWMSSKQSVSNSCLVEMLALQTGEPVCELSVSRTSF